MSALLSLAVLRAARAGDRHFLRSSWLRSCAETLPRPLQTAYYESQHRAVDRLLDAAQVAIACARDDEDQILGWACGELYQGRQLVHWCYVKSAFRGHGLARACVERVCGEITSDSRPIITHPVKWESIGQRLQKRGWTVYPTLGVHLANGREAA